MRRSSVTSLLAGLALVFVTSPAHAFTGGRLFATGSEVWIRFLDSEAAYTSDLYLCTAPDLASCPTFVLRNKTTAAGTDLLLPGTFTPGQEVILGLNVVSTGNWFFSGPAERNADGEAHLLAGPLAGDARYTLRGGFEDIRGGGDRDYDDLRVDLAGLTLTPVPEPESVVLMATGLLALGGMARRRRERQR